MSDWLRRFADALDEEPLPPEEISTILDLTRDVAHGTERKLAPLTSYLVGIQVGKQLAAGADRDEAFDDTVQRVLDALPDRSGDGPDTGHLDGPDPS